MRNISHRVRRGPWRFHPRRFVDHVVWTDSHRGVPPTRQSQTAGTGQPPGSQGLRARSAACGPLRGFASVCGRAINLCPQLEGPGGQRASARSVKPDVSTRVVCVCTRCHGPSQGLQTEPSTRTAAGCWEHGVQPQRGVGEMRCSLTGGWGRRAALPMRNQRAQGLGAAEGVRTGLCTSVDNGSSGPGPARVRERAGRSQVVCSMW